MYSLNKNFVERPDEKCYFDSVQFRVIQMNPTGYAILSHLDGRPFEQSEYFQYCNDMRVTPEASTKFWEKCLEKHLIVMA